MVQLDCVLVIIRMKFWTRATVNLLTPACYANQNVSCHLLVLDDVYSKDKDAILGHS